MTLGIAPRRARRRWLGLIVVWTVATLITASSVVAFAPGPGTGNLDPFNPSNAAPDCPPAGNTALTNAITAANAGSINDGTCDPGLGSVTVHWITDTVSGSSTDNAWGQGDKSDCYLAKTGGVSGACVTQVFGIGASKTDLQYHGISLAQGSNGHEYLYSGIKRAQAGGVTSSNANYAVEVNQQLAAYQPAAPICTGTVPAGGGSCNMWRSPGDLIFMTDWGGNQSSCNIATPAICAYVWIDFSTGTGKTPSPAGSTCFSASSAPCWGLLPNTSAALSSNPDLAAGSIDAATSTFSEIGVDLTQANLIPSGACETFNTVWAHSRSSSSFSAELKDFIFGNVSLSTCTGTTTQLHQTDAAGADVSPSNNGLEITVTPGSYVSDVATVTPSSTTGSVNFRFYGSSAACIADTAGSAGTNVSTNTLSGGSPDTATSTAQLFNSVGDFWWRAFYIPGNLSASASSCNEIVHVVKFDTNLATGPWYYPNDQATVTAPNGGGTPSGSVSFALYDTLANCQAGGATGQLYTQSVNLPGSSPFTVNTSNTTVQVSTSTTVYWRVAFSSTNPAQFGRNSFCTENINATLTGDSSGTAP